VETLGMGGLGGLEGTISNRVSVLHYFEKHVLEPCVAAKNKSVRLTSHSGQYLASGVG
jgi:hypothetical protein